MPSRHSKQSERLLIVGLVIAMLSLGAIPSSAQQPVNAQEAYELGVEAYIYFYPLILMDVTRRVAINVESGTKPGIGPMNMFHHFRESPTAEFRTVVRPNFDTFP